MRAIVLIALYLKLPADQLAKPLLLQCVPTRPACALGRALDRAPGSELEKEGST
jgi:hypothetical protein